MNLEAIHATLNEALSPFQGLFDVFEKAGFQLYAVGGCVRDWCLGKKPKDVDFTTDATPAETTAVLLKNGMKVIPVGEAFGTIATLIERKSYEITSFRVKESYTKGSRHPVVRYGKSLSQDLERRDLTINAMAANRHGELIDPFDGTGDLEKGILCVPRSTFERSIEIFSDDPLRILRLARFLARLNFSVAPEATRAAQTSAGTVLEVSRERWFAELDGLLRAHYVSAGIDWLRETGVLGLLFPELAMLQNIAKRPISLSGDIIDSHETNLLEETCELVVASVQQGASPWAAFFALTGFGFTNNAAWGANVSSLVADSLLSRLKVSNALREQTLHQLEPLPQGAPTRRKVRELAQLLLADLPMWLNFQSAKLRLLPQSTRSAEEARLSDWKTALAPYLADPQSAPIRWPSELSKTLSQQLGLKGKTLGLCLKYCAEAVLDDELSDHDSVEQIVLWAKNHFDPDESL